MILHSRYHHWCQGSHVCEFDHETLFFCHMKRNLAILLFCSTNLGTILAANNLTIVLPDAVVLPDPVNLHLEGNHYEPVVADEEPERSPSLVATHGSRSPSPVMPSQEIVAEPAPRDEPSVIPSPSNNPESEPQPEPEDEGSVVASTPPPVPEPEPREDFIVESSPQRSDSDFVSEEEPAHVRRLANVPLTQCTPPREPKAKRRKVREPVKPKGPAQLASIVARTSAEYPKSQRSQRTAPGFSTAEVILFRRMWEELNLDVRQAKGWERFERRWKEEHKKDATDQIRDRNRKSLQDHATRHRKEKKKEQEAQAATQAAKEKEQEAQATTPATTTTSTATLSTAPTTTTTITPTTPGPAAHTAPIDPTHPAAAWIPPRDLSLASIWTAVG